MSRYVQKVLSRKPFGGSSPWFAVAIGCFSFLVGLFMTSSDGLTFILLGLTNVALGLVFVFQGASDLLPKERKVARVLLRASFLILGPAAVVLGIASIAVEIAPA